MKMLALIALTLLAIGVNGSHVSHQLLSAPKFTTHASSGYVSGGNKLISSLPYSSGLSGGFSGLRTYGYSGLGGLGGYSNGLGYLSSPVYSGLGGLGGLGGGYIASAPLSSGYISSAYSAPAYTGSYYASAPVTTGFSGISGISGISGLNGGYIASAPLASSGYVSTGYASPVLTGSYIASAPVATSHYVQQPKIIEQNPIHHVQVVHQPKYKEVTVVRKPGQQIVKVLPAAVHETQKVYNLPAARPTGIVALGHGSRKTVENKVVVEQNKISPIEEGGSDLAPGHDLNGSYQPQQPAVSSVHTASAPRFSNFAKEDTQVKYDTK